MKKKQVNAQLLSIIQTSLTWQGLTATVKDKIIIQNCTGCCRPGEMLAIMGSSGAGKTTLLTLLAGKKAPQLKITGKVEANKIQFSSQQFYNFGVYIYQNDILHQSLTVRQTLQFIAKLKYKNNQEIQQRVNELIQIFQLQKCQNTYVGGRTTKGISGGQKKRVSIAMQMVAKPSLIILDQPTTGLDSNKAYKIVKILKKIAKEQNRAIIFTLSQPSSETYKQLDKLMLLDKGKVLYQGKSQSIYQYMISLNIKVPQNSSLSDFFIMQISQFKALKDQKQSQMSHEAYSLKLQPLIVQQIKKVKKDVQCQGFSKLKPVRSFLFSFKLLLWRQFIIFIRNPSKGIRILLNAIFMLIVHGLIFLHSISDNRPVPISQNQTIAYPLADLIFYFITAQGIIYVSIFTNIMTAISNVTLSFPTDRQIFYKETISKKYVPFAYLLAKIIMETVSIFFGVFLYGICVYFMIGYNENIALFCLSLMCTTMVGNSLGIMSGSFYKDAKKSSALSLQLVPPMILLGGLYNKIKSIPEYIRWLTYMSPFREGIHSLLMLEYKENTYKSVQGKVYDFRQDLSVQLSYWENIGVLFGIAAFYYLVAFIFMIKKSSS